jgi:uncharacterized protein YukE
MAEGKEIKVNEEAFNNTISKVTEYKDGLVEVKGSFVSVNENMKKDWIGDGGTAFMLNAKALEASFSERINDLEEETKALEDAKQSLFNEDNYLSGAIAGSITVTAAAAVAIEVATSVINKSN